VGKYTYEGMFFDGLKCGKGVESMPDGSKFIGIFDEGLRCGPGKLYGKEGSVIKEGEFDEPAGDDTKINTFLDLNLPKNVDEYGRIRKEGAVVPEPAIQVTKSDIKSSGDQVAHEPVSFAPGGSLLIPKLKQNLES
jgi:hypothetical protein